MQTIQTDRSTLRIFVQIGKNLWVSYQEKQASWDRSYLPF